MKRRPFENFVGKGENAGKQHFPPSPTMFSTDPKTNFLFLVTLILLSGNALNLNQAKNWYDCSLNKR